jgi:hypothetical protein
MKIIFALIVLLVLANSQQAPNEFKVILETTMGNMTLNIKRSYSPNGF